MKSAAVALLLLTLSPNCTLAQSFEDLLGGLGSPPEVNVSLDHPPSLGLDIKRVAFGPAEGECADEFVDALVADFVNNGVEVIDRGNVQTLLDEHKFASTGMVDRQTAAELGKILGPTALVFVSVRRCATEGQRLQEQARSYTAKSGRQTVYYAETTAFFKASVQIIDLSTARIHSAVPVEERHEQRNRSTSGWPEAPSKFDVLDTAMGRGVHQVHRLFFPWTEVRTLHFFDVDTCGMKIAYGLVAGGQYQMALDQSVTNVQLCANEKPKPKARAYYNLGMSQCLLGHFDDAISNFRQSLTIKTSKYASEAMVECQNAKNVAQALQESESAAELPDVQVAQGGPNATVGNPTSGTAEGESIEARLKKLQTLHDKGLITDEEYQTKRDAILAEL